MTEIVIKGGNMKLYDYKKLTEEEQYRILWQKGELIDACIEGEIRKLLYAIDNFYVELWCHALTNKFIWKLSFKQGKLLEKYLDKYNMEVIKNYKK
ncbi:hypothetical protein [Flavobacterium rhizosphaerae]|uniref:Uncharacterized protein n=1 Tax=Flavobacterium rhizosphaerae TaxID=3163298 RepID=A0ABW8YXJ5_9FLAO